MNASQQLKQQKIDLRWYQREAIDSIYEYFKAAKGNPLVIAPTGAGKSIIIGKFCQEIIEKWPQQRILVLTHVAELVEQNYSKLRALWPTAPAGVYSASLGRRDVTSSVIFASIQSIHSKAMTLGWFDLVIVDEAHLIPDTGEGMYNSYLSDLRGINPNIKVVGLTATAYRMKSGSLVGDDTLFTDIAYDKCTIRTLVEESHLSPLVTRPVSTSIDTSSVKQAGGEYVLKSLQAAADVDEITAAAVAEIVALGANRKSWLVFCTGVSHAEHVRDAIRAAGISCETITGKTPKQQRAKFIAMHKAGMLQCLTNADVLTTGFDSPAIDLLAVLRPTGSPGLWVQICGRGMRTAPGKSDCLLLDFAGNTERHGPIDMIEVERKKKRKPGENDAPPGKQCPLCEAITFLSARVCECGYEFTAGDDKPIHERTASTDPALSFLAGNETVFNISSMSFHRHKKQGKRDSVRVVYKMLFVEVAREWLFFDSHGPMRERSKMWWQHWVDDSPPNSTDEALERLGTSAQCGGAALTLKRNGKYKEVVKWMRGL